VVSFTPGPRFNPGKEPSLTTGGCVGLRVVLDKEAREKPFSFTGDINPAVQPAVTHYTL
jgi:hypothetical protein